MKLLLLVNFFWKLVIKFVVFVESLLFEFLVFWIFLLNDVNIWLIWFVFWLLDLDIFFMLVVEVISLFSWFFKLDNCWLVVFCELFILDWFCVMFWIFMLIDWRVLSCFLIVFVSCIFVLVIFVIWFVNLFWLFLIFFMIFLIFCCVLVVFLFIKYLVILFLIRLIIVLLIFWFKNWLNKFCGFLLLEIM